MCCVLVGLSANFSIIFAIFLQFFAFCFAYFVHIVHIYLHIVHIVHIYCIFIAYLLHIYCIFIEYYAYFARWERWAIVTVSTPDSLITQAPEQSDSKSQCQPECQADRVSDWQWAAAAANLLRPVSSNLLPGWVPEPAPGLTVLLGE